MTPRNAVESSLSRVAYAASCVEHPSTGREKEKEGGFCPFASSFQTDSFIDRSVEEGGDLERFDRVLLRFDRRLPRPITRDISKIFVRGIFPEKGRGRNSKLVITRWRQPLAISSFVARSSVSSSARLSSQVAGGREGSSKKLASSYVRGYVRLCAEWNVPKSLCDGRPAGTGRYWDTR